MKRFIFFVMCLIFVGCGPTQEETNQTKKTGESFAPGCLKMAIIPGQDRSMSTLLEDCCSQRCKGILYSKGGKLFYVCSGECQEEGFKLFEK